MKRTAFLSLVLALSAAGCGESSTPTTPSADIPTTTTGFFGGTLSTMGSVPNTFVVSTAGPVEVTLLTLTTPAGNVQNLPIALAVGTLTDTVCTPTTTVNVTAALKAQLRTNLAAGTFCVNVADIGNVTDDLSFTLRVVSLPLIATPTSTTETFSSNLTPGGSASRTFTVTTSGTVTATLQSFGASVDVGFAIGVANVTTSLCTATTVVTGQSGTSISLPADPSTYCVKIFDPGKLAAATTSFTISIVHP
jgi:hypothetical protein